MEYGDQPDIFLENNYFLSYFKVEETTKILNQVDRPRDLNLEPPEWEPRALTRSHLARFPAIFVQVVKSLKTFLNANLFFHFFF